MKRYIVLILFILIPFLNIQAGTEWTGTSGAPFLKIPVSSRYIGTGEAGSCFMNNAAALAENPSILGNLKNMEILFSHYEWIIDLDYEHVAFVKPITKKPNIHAGTFGVGITYLHLPFFKEYGMWGETIGEMTANSLALYLGYGIKIADYGVGTTLKFIREQYAEESDFAVGWDVAGYYVKKLHGKFAGIDFTGKSLHFSFIIRNITLSGIDEYSLPTSVKFSTGMEIFEGFTLAMDMEKPVDNRFRLNLGTEYNFMNYVNIRAGYRFWGYETDTFTIGVGAQYPIGTKLTRIDIAYAPQASLKNTLILSVGVKFPGIASADAWKMANILYYKGIYYYTNGDLDKAIQCWKEVLKYNPGHTKALEKIKDAEYLKKLKEVEKKVKYKYNPEEE